MFYVDLYLEVYIPDDFSLLIQVNSSRHFLTEELREVRHFVGSLRRLLSKLSLAVTEQHTAQSRIRPIFSTCVICGQSTDQ